MKIDDRNKLKEHYQKKRVTSNYVKNRFYEPMGIIKHEKQLHLINKYLKTIKDPIILDLACGPARISKDINNIKVGYAVDSSPNMLELARKEISDKWVVQEVDAFSLKFPAASFDLITSFRFLRHFKYSDRRKLLYEVSKVLKPNGLFILDFLNEKTAKKLKLIGKHKYIVYDELYNLKKMNLEMFNNGFEIVEIRPVINHVFIQSVISKITHRLGFNKFGYKLGGLFEKWGGGNPWEWVVVCRKK